jgi:hypothetical protein
MVEPRSTGPFVPVCPSPPTFYAHCAECGKAFASTALYADMGHPFCYVCVHCVVRLRKEEDQHEEDT